jgi:hypothetical protein
MKLRAMNDLGGELQLDETVNKAINHLIDAARSSLQEFLPGSKMESFHNRTKSLIMDARDLHTMMMMSKAIFSLQWLGDDDGVRFAQYDPTSMESVQSDIDAHTSHNSVEFVEVPALVKYGNADGEGFEFSSTLCKASVVLREMEVISSSEDESITLPDTTGHDEACNDLSSSATGSIVKSERQPGFFGDLDISLEKDLQQEKV